MIFVDTTVWVGDADESDELHESSHKVLEALRLGRTPLALTSDFVIEETVTILGRRRGFGAARARDTAEAILASPKVFTVYVDESLLKEGIETYPEYRGRLSLTDVISVVIMEKYGVGEVFSHDTDFDLVKGIKRRETA